MIETIEAGFAMVGVVVAAATCIVAGLEKIAGITPTTKDDAFVSKTKQILGVVSSVLDRFSTWTPKK